MNPTMNAIDIVVSDLDAAIAFYRRLGLEFEIDHTCPSTPSCDLPNGLHLMLDTENLRGKTTLRLDPAGRGARAPSSPSSSAAPPKSTPRTPS